MKGQKSISDRIAEYGELARSRLRPHFEKAGIKYPPAKLCLVGLKSEKQLLLYATDSNGAMKFVCSYPVIQSSGVLGPKLCEGDLQVPEGLYKIELLNPNSRFHLSLRVDYPNDFDREMGRLDKREMLGSDIMIHGSNCSVGCLAMGDEVSEDLFVLAHDTGIENISVILAPYDFRKPPAATKILNSPPWVEKLYAQIKSELAKLPLIQD